MNTSFPEMPAIVVSTGDQRRLTQLALDSLHRAPDVAAELLAEMERAEVLDLVPSNVVQMGSSVTFADDQGRRQDVTLVYPGQADIGAGCISILTPIGTALIGLAEGQSIAWTTRDGRRRSLTVIGVKPGSAAKDAAGA
jgi:regulator of nucleoside diphosphate kinase